ncbi:hypothetical protein FRC09_009702, partial [Ceratobasidium sp. 395]
MAVLDWKLKRPKMHKPGFRDPIPNTDQFKSDIYCEHEGEYGSSTALSVLQDIFPEFNPPNVETETCSVCEAVARPGRPGPKLKLKGYDRDLPFDYSAHVQQTRLQGIARKDLASLEASELVEGPDYALVPYSFVTQWRTWISKPLAALRPGSVLNEQFICSHNKLTVDPTEPLDANGVICAISVRDWEIIHELYGGGPFIRFTVEEAMSDEKYKLLSDIPLCTDCRTLRLSNLDNVSINVYRLAEGESLPW